MARKLNIALLKQVARIRAVQRTVAEASASDAAQAARAKEDAQREAEQARDQAAEAWEESASTRFDPAISSLWGRQLVRQQAALHSASSEADSAAKERERRAGDFHVATKQNDSAGNAVRDAIKKRSRDREEAATQEALDLHLQRRPPE